MSRSSPPRMKIAGLFLGEYPGVFRDKKIGLKSLLRRGSCIWVPSKHQCTTYVIRQTPSWTSLPPVCHLPLRLMRSLCGQMFGVDEVVFEVFQIIIIQCEPPFEDTIGDALLLLQQLKHVCQDRIVVHYRPSTCASA